MLLVFANQDYYLPLISCKYVDIFWRYLAKEKQKPTRFQTALLDSFSSWISKTKNVSNWFCTALASERWRSNHVAYYVQKSPKLPLHVEKTCVMCYTQIDKIFKWNFVWFINLVEIYVFVLDVAYDSI